MRILLATGDKNLDSFVRQKLPDQTIGECYYREAVRDSSLKYSADTLLIASGLPGAQDLRNVVFAARMDGLRCVCLLSEADKEKGLGYELMALGVYDILTSPVNAEDIIASLRVPATFADAANKLKVQTAPKSGGLRALLGKHNEFRERPGTTDKTAAAQAEGAGETPSAEAAKRPRVFLRKRGVESGSQDERLEGLDTSRPLIPVWSPVPAGKTFVAVNLAWTLSKSMPATLVDLDPKQAVREWLCLADGEESLLKALDSGGETLEPATVGLLKVFCYDSAAWSVRRSAPALKKLLESGGEGEPVVLDLPAAAGPLEDSLVKAAGVCILVGDPDWSRRRAVKKAWETLVERGIWPLLVLNRYVDVDDVAGWKPEVFAGVKPAVVIRASASEAYRACATGKPGVELVDEWRTAFEELAVKTLMLVQKTRNAKAS